MTAKPQGQGQSDLGGPGLVSRLGATLRKSAKALWMVFSLVLYGLGFMLFNGGRGLMGISGWRFGRDK